MGFNRVARVRDAVPVRHVLVSAYDKSGLGELAVGMAAACPGIVFYATGGSLSFLGGVLGAGAARLVAVSDYTGQPEMGGGLVKTLDWKIYLGLLAEEGDSSHEADLERAGAVRFDMVVANLYPFEAAAALASIVDARVDAEDLRQRIDIGGPAMIRAAAKNFLRVASVSSPAQYPAVLAALRAGGSTGLALRRRLAAEAFALTSRFDAAVAARLAALDGAGLGAAYHLG